MPDNKLVDILQVLTINRIVKDISKIISCIFTDWMDEKNKQ